MKQVGLLILSLLISATIYAQNSTFKGKIIDQETGEELIGATVLLMGTNYGSVADINGNYILDEVPAGTYDIMCQYISYNPKVVKSYNVQAGKTENLNFILEPTALSIDEVVVSAKAVRRTESAMLIMQMKSSSVIDAISSQQISKAGDSDAASALKRVTGVSVQNGKYVYIRGLSDRYMMTTLNGIIIPGLDPNRNTVQMDLFPTNILENIVVHKSFTPELPGSFTGGLVDITTRDFPEEFTLSASISLGLNTQASFNSDYLSYKGGNTDWLGIDDGTRKLPSLASGQIPKLGEIDKYPELTKITESFNKIWKLNKTTPFLNQSYSISVGNQSKLFGKTFGWLTALSYSNKYKYYDNGIRGKYHLVGSNSNSLVEDYKYEDKKSENSILWSAMANGSLKLSQNNTISASILYNHSGVKETRMLTGPNPEKDPEMFYQTRLLNFEERSFVSGQLKGEHLIKSMNKLKVDWITSISSSKIEQPDFRNFNNSFYITNGDTIYEIDPAKYAVPTRFYRDLNETSVFGKVDFKLPVKLFDNKSNFQFGLSYNYRDRTFRDKRYDFKDQNNSFTGNVDDYFSDSNIGINAPSWSEQMLLGVFVSNSDKNNLINSYNGDQSVGAAYLSLKLPIRKKFKILVGARLEQTLINVNSLSDEVKAGELDNLDILPSINFTYHISDKANLRLAYSRTLARPTFRELAPYASFDFMGGDIIVGNSNLQRTLIDNIDLRWEYFPRPSETVAASVFYKNFDNPIEKTYNPEAANPELTWRNVNNAKVIGLELDFRKKLDFIDLLRNFNIGINASIIYSSVDVDKAELEHIRKTEPSYPTTRVMAGQSPYIINTSLGYKNDSVGIESNLSFNVSGKRLVIVNSGGTPNIYEQPSPSLNFNISKKIGSMFKLKFALNNILNPVFKQTYTRYNEDNSWKGQEYIYSSYKKGLNFSIGLSLKL
ncbi:MAG: TonB-dependent receptor domain-containing protein [Hyphomicrobiales bacterium]